MKRYVLLSLLSFLDSSFASSELLSVVQIFRHGERTPVVFYPTDPYQDSKYWNGLPAGTLTQNGKLQLENLGRYFRQRYDGFLSDEYKNEEILIKSSHADRNIQSAKSFINGLYMNAKEKIPVEESERHILSNVVICARFNIEYLKLEGTNNQLVEIHKNNQKIYRHIRQHSEFPIFGLISAIFVFDNLHLVSTANLTLPEWTKSVYPNELTKLSEDVSLFWCYNREQQKYGVGGFLNNLIEYFQNIADGSEKRKSTFYSGHDINILCLLSTMGYYQKNKPHMPVFASSMYFELRKDRDTGEYFVNVYYKPENEVIPISINGCEFDCEFEKFKSLFNDIRLTREQWIKQCYYLE